jgi:DNA/RNA endonuclease G (NUC1)
MSKSRPTAMFVGANIDSRQSMRIEHDRDTWFLDGRIPTEAGKKL